VRKDHCRRIHRQRLLDHIALIDRGLQHRAAQYLLERNDAVLRIQEGHAEHLVLQCTQLQAQTALHGLRRRHRGAAPHAVGQQAPRLTQHLVGMRRTVLTIDIADQQGVGGSDG
jgi:hypothetical protein